MEGAQCAGIYTVVMKLWFHPKYCYSRDPYLAHMLYTLFFEEPHFQLQIKAAYVHSWVIKCSC